MCSPGLYPVVDGYYEDATIAILEERNSRYPINFTSFPSFPGGPASPSEQFVAAESQGSNASNWAAFDQEPVHMEEAAAEASAFTDDLQYSTPNSYLLSHDLGIPPDPPYSTLTGEMDYPRTEVEFTFAQYATQLASTLHLRNAIPHDDGITEQVHPPCGSPATYRDQTEGYLPSSSATPNDGHEFYDAVSPATSSDFNRAYLLDIGVVGSLLLLDDTICASPTSGYREAGLSGTAGPSVSGCLDGTENDEATRQPKRPLSPDIDNVISRNPKKRKRPDAQMMPRKVKYGRQSISQHDSPQQRSVQPTPSSLPRPFNLCIIQQVKYKCGNTQKWTKHPDIVFKVGGVDGIRLTEAMDTYFNGPDDRDQLMFTNGNFGGSFSCRISFEGYQTSKVAKQISTSNYKAEKDRITKKKLAEYTAKRVKAYLEELADAGTPYRIPFEDMVLTRLIHVSKASFQPEICYQATSSGSTSI